MPMLDGVENYYERLVVDALTEMPEARSMDPETFMDIVCLALNQLPPKYYRHAVDMAFFLPEGERVAMYDRTDRAVREAMTFILESERGR